MDFQYTILMIGKIWDGAVWTRQGLTDVLSYDYNDTGDRCDHDDNEPIYKHGAKVCNQFKYCENGEHVVGTCPEGQYFDTVVGESVILCLENQ